MNIRRVRQLTTPSLIAALLSMWLIAVLGTAAKAAEYTAKEMANIALIRGLFDALNAAEARGDQAKVIDSIAEKYMAEDFKQYGRTPRDRSAWEALFKGNNGVAEANGPPAARTPEGNSRGPEAAPRQPLRELAIMADGDRVGYTGTRDGSTITYHLFRISEGMIVEEW
jgi:hypothetical protein